MVGLLVCFTDFLFYMVEGGGVKGLMLSGPSLKISLITALLLLITIISYGVQNCFGSIMISYLMRTSLLWFLIPGCPPLSNGGRHLSSWEA